MNKLNNRIGLADISEETLNKSFNTVQKKVITIKKELEVIGKVFKGLNAQDRLIMFDVLQGIIIDMSSVSTFLVIAILEKYKHLTLSGNRVMPISSVEVDTDTGPTDYIG